MVLPQDALFHIIDRSNEGNDWQNVIGRQIRNPDALIPEKVFASNSGTISMRSLQGQESLALDFLKLSTYLISNNFHEATAAISKLIYKGMKHFLDTGLLKYLFSIDGDTTKELESNLFTLAIDANDFDLVKKMMDWGVNPNARAYSDFSSRALTPLHRACWLQSVEVVQVLIDGGADLDINAPEMETNILSVAIDPDDIYHSHRYPWFPSLFNRPHDSTDEGRHHKEQVKIKLIQILLRAGATVNLGRGPSPLATAAKIGYTKIVALLIAAGSNVNFSGFQVLSTPLIDAVTSKEDIPERDLVTIVRSLLQAGADVQGPFNRNTTVLEAAIPRQSDLVVQLLLNSGARITQSAFANAAKYCNLDTVDLFIKSGAQVTEEIIRCAAKNKDSESFWFLLDAAEDGIKHKCKCAALAQCIYDGNLSLIDKLEASGAELNSDVELATARSGLEAAAKRGDMHVLRLVLDIYSRYQRVGMSQSLTRGLTAAILNGQNDATGVILTAGADVNTESWELDPLSAAIIRKDSHLVRRLVAAGAAVNKTAEMKGFKEEDFPVVTTVLPAVVFWGDCFLIQDIIDAGADVNAPRHPRGETALAVAINRGDAKIIELLIDAGANVNADAALIYGPTALEVASRNNDLSMVQFLLGLGADPDEWSLVEAVSGSVELVQTLLAARLGRYHRYSKGYGCRALQYAIDTEKANMVEILLANGIDPNEIIRRKFNDGPESDSRGPYFPEPGFPWCRPTIVFGVSALGYAIQEDKSDDLWIVQMLLNSGADPNSIMTNSFYSDGRFRKGTALLKAIDLNYLDMVKKLINAGADANPGTRIDIVGTPLQKAAEIGSMDIVHLLLGHGADVNAPPHYDHGATALQFAAIGGYMAIALLLLEKGANVNALPAQIDGRTALEGAAEHGRKDMVQLLLNAGAQITGIGGEQYERALEFASKNRQASTRRLLEEYKDQSWESLVDWHPTSIGSGVLSDF